MSLVEEFFKQYDELADKYEKYTSSKIYFFVEKKKRDAVSDLFDLF